MQQLFNWGGNSMRTAFFSLLFLVSTGVQAVTVDFESDISYYDAGGVASKGFDFVSLVYYWDFITDGDGNTAIEQSRHPCECYGIDWDIWGSESENYNLESMDLAFDAGLAPELVIEGLHHGSESVFRTITDTAWHTEIFGHEWKNLDGVRIYIISAEPQWIAIDNFSATIVPIPAAIWLFGSALAGLGWVRRKQTI
jgi:hypothetical protein